MFVLLSSVVHSLSLLDLKCQSGIFCVYKKILSLRLISDARRSNQHFTVPPTFSMATGYAFSRVELLLGTPDEGEAPALHSAFSDVQDAFHHMDIHQWLRPYSA